MTHEPWEKAAQLMDEVGRNAGPGGPEFTDYVNAVTEDAIRTHVVDPAYEAIETAYQNSDFDASKPPSGGDTGAFDDLSQPPTALDE